MSNRFDTAITWQYNMSRSFLWNLQQYSNFVILVCILILSSLISSSSWWSRYKTCPCQNISGSNRIWKIIDKEKQMTHTLYLHTKLMLCNISISSIHNVNILHVTFSILCMIDLHTQKCLEARFLSSPSQH